MYSIHYTVHKYCTVDLNISVNSLKSFLCKISIVIIPLDISTTFKCTSNKPIFVGIYLTIAGATEEGFLNEKTHICKTQ